MKNRDAFWRCNANALRPARFRSGGFPDTPRQGEPQIAERMGEEKPEKREFGLIQPCLQFLDCLFPFGNHVVGLALFDRHAEIAEFKYSGLLGGVKDIVGNNTGAEVFDTFHRCFTPFHLEQEALDHRASRQDMNLPDIADADDKKTDPENRTITGAVAKSIDIAAFKNMKPTKDEHDGTSCAISLFFRLYPRTFFKPVVRSHFLQDLTIYPEKIKCNCFEENTESGGFFHKALLPGRDCAENIWKSSILRAASRTNMKAFSALFHRSQNRKRFVKTFAFWAKPFSGLMIGQGSIDVKFNVVFHSKPHQIKLFQAFPLSFFHFDVFFGTKTMEKVKEY